MNYHAIYFSPTYTTKKIVCRVMERLSKDFLKHDIINLKSENKVLEFKEDDFLLIGVPVYSGRVPSFAKSVIERMRGNKTPVALIATFGNRHFDDALLELKTIVEANGFVTIAAAAFVTEHSVVRKFGAGRPDDLDISEINNFADKISQKIKKWDANSSTPLVVDGNKIYREYKSIPLKPHANSQCNSCGLCSKSCPVGAIQKTNPKVTDKKICFTCMRCVYVCPKNARGFHWFEKVIAEKSLAKMCNERKENKIFI